MAKQEAKATTQIAVRKKETIDLVTAKVKDPGQRGTVLP